MINLMNLEPTRITKDLKGKFLMIYGNPKCGKTTFASKFDKALLFAFEPGYNGLDNIMAQPVLTWSEFKVALKQLEKEPVKEKFHTIIIDTADVAWSCCEKYVLAQNLSASGEIPTSLGDIPWGAGFTNCKKEFDEALRKIATLGYGLVIISHSKVVKPPKDREGVDKFVPTLGDMPKLIVNRLVDVIAYLHTKENGERFLYTRGNEFFEAGSRFQYLDSQIALDYNELVKKLGEAIDEEAKANGNSAAESGENAFYKNEEKVAFKDLLEEAKSIFVKAIETDGAKAEKLNNVIFKVFNKQIKLSETTEEQRELVEAVLNEWRTI